MKNARLVTLDPAIQESLVNNSAYIGAMVEEDWARVAELVHQLVGRTLTVDPLTTDTLDWDGYFVVDGDTRDVVGSCGYKGQPTADGTVEIAYFTYPGFEGRGYATTMARKLIDLAAGSPVVKRVIAHTLPQASASTRVLEKVAMSFVGEVEDPDDGRVWRWQLEM